MISLRETKPKPTGPPEDLEFEIQFFEGVVKRDRDFIEALQILGDAYTKTGRWDKGLKIDQRLSRLCPDNPLVFYNLACSYSLMGKLDAAIGALTKAVNLGYDDGKWLNKDPDLENLRQDARFERIRRDLSREG